MGQGSLWVKEIVGQGCLWVTGYTPDGVFHNNSCQGCLWVKDACGSEMFVAQQRLHIKDACGSLHVLPTVHCIIILAKGWPP